MKDEKHSANSYPGRIKRAAEQQQGTPARKSELPIIGTLRTGAKAKNTAGVEYPVSLDYFIATGDYAKKFDEAYPDKPSVIPILFISNDLTQSCNERFELRDDKGKLFGYGDGETFYVWDLKMNNEKGGYLKRNPDDENDAAIIKGAPKSCKSSKGWEILLTISFVIPKIKGVLGAWTFSTKGKASSIPAIRDTFDMVKARAGDSIIGIPFDLTVKKVTTQKPGSKNLFPVVSIIPNISQESLDLVRELLASSNLDLNRIKILTEENIKALSAKNESDTKAIGDGSTDNTPNQTETAQNSTNDKTRSNLFEE